MFFYLQINVFNIYDIGQDTQKRSLWRMMALMIRRLQPAVAGHVPGGSWRASGREFFRRPWTPFSKLAFIVLFLFLL